MTNGNENSPVTAWFINSISTGTVIAAVVGWMPAIAAGVALVWYVIQIYESNTTQSWLRRTRLQKIARLKARVLLMEAQHKGQLSGLDRDDPDEAA